MDKLKGALEKAENLSAFEYALLKLNEGELLDVIADFAKQDFDGHFTILSFTTGYKIAFYTPCLDNNDGRNQVAKLPSFKTMKEAMIHAILYHQVF